MKQAEPSTRTPDAGQGRSFRIGQFDLDGADGAKMGKLFRLFGALLFVLSQNASADVVLPASKGQYIYLPVYSHIYQGARDKRGKPEMAQLSALVSIRNTDDRHQIRVTSARYFDTGGKLVKEFAPTPQMIPPFGTLELFIERDDVSGGSGANFAISWDADIPASPPLIEAVHSMSGPRSFAFITSGRVLKAPD